MDVGLSRLLNKDIRQGGLLAISGTGKVSLLQIHASAEVVLVCVWKCRLLNLAELGKI
jgi:hypothetical protein